MNTSPLDPPRRSAHSESLEALEKFLQQLPQTHDIGGQMRLTLGLVRSATRSDAVLLDDHDHDAGRQDNHDDLTAPTADCHERSAARQLAPADPADL